MIKVASLAVIATLIGMAPANAASVFHFNGGCDMTCSGDWGIGEREGSVSCRGKITLKTGCPRSIDTSGPAVLTGPKSLKKSAPLPTMFGPDGSLIDGAQKTQSVEVKGKCRE
jgi:hypothetical protein